MSIIKMLRNLKARYLSCRKAFSTVNADIASASPYT
jgi:hypothetical protein